MPHHCGKVARFTGVIGAIETIGFAAAAAQMHKQTVKTMLLQCLHHCARIVRIDRSFETMHHHHERAITIKPAKIQKVAIIQLQPFAAAMNSLSAEQDGPQGLQVRVYQPPEGFEC